MDEPRQRVQTEAAASSVAGGDDSAALVTVVDDSGTDLGLKAVTPELARLLARAARVNHRVEPTPDLSFSSILISLVGGVDPVSSWFRAYLSNTDVNIPALLRVRDLPHEEDLHDLLDPDVEPHELANPLVATFSFTTLLRTAIGMAADYSPGEPVDVRHIIGAYIYDGAGHDRDFDNLRFDRPNWSVAFVSFLAAHHPDEVRSWAAAHGKRYPATILGPLDGSGPTPRIATDQWTTADTLGHSAYALALARFLRHKDTEAPVAIAIQAPWGGGKTSLMRMLREELTRGDGSTAPVVPSPPPEPSRQGLRLGEVLKIAAAEAASPARHPLDGASPGTITVWFNAWKYENTNQVWAGLADAILHQLADQLPPDKRELFWLRLNFRRVDPDQVRQRIHDRLFRLWWRTSRAWLLGLAAVVGTLLMTAAGAASIGLDMVRDVGLVGTPLALALGGLGAAGRWLSERRKVNDEPASVALVDLVTAPAYRDEIGFVHEVEADVRRALWALEQTSPTRLVIFIDDLDRCPPTRVAQVVEAVNLFLGGELPGCLFVLGVDAEMVAAALQAAHAQLTEQLPPGSDAPLGWRFMDKFIQLPFVIPPPTERDRQRYADSLLGYRLEDRLAADDPVAHQALAGIRDRIDIGPTVERLRRQGQLAPEREAALRRLLEVQAERAEIERGIATFDDANTAIRLQVQQAAKDFSGNPRELKRFVNTFRFLYFLSWAAQARTGRAVSLAQLRRWVELSLRWPATVRWVWRGPADRGRLRQLEDLAAQSETYDAWRQKAPDVLGLEPARTPWLGDPALHAFWRAELDLAEADRLTGGIGRGLW